MAKATADACKISTQATAPYPATPIADESLGAAMLYSSGTTGRPKGILRPLPMQPPSQPLPLYGFVDKLWRYRDGMIYLSPAPLYHSAPQAAVSLAIDRASTVIIMESFDAERYLQLVETYKVTHSQLVPTMFSRMLKLPPEVRQRYDLSSLEIAVHAAAPCPVPVKEEMIAWWGPIIHEYYGATEGLGFAACDSAQWLAHKGTVGKVHARRASRPRCRHAAVSNRNVRHAVVQDRHAVRVFQRSGRRPRRRGRATAP